jgi:hypothetical protein
MDGGGATGRRGWRTVKASGLRVTLQAEASLCLSSQSRLEFISKLKPIQQLFGPESENVVKEIPYGNSRFAIVDRDRLLVVSVRRK